QRYKHIYARLPRAVGGAPLSRDRHGPERSRVCSAARYAALRPGLGVRALLKPAMHVMGRACLSDAEGSYKIGNAVRKLPAGRIGGIEAVRRGLGLAPELGLVNGQKLSVLEHEFSIDHDALHRRPAFRKGELQQRSAERHAGYVAER